MYAEFSDHDAGSQETHKETGAQCSLMQIEEHHIEQPRWLDALVETVMEAMAPLGFMGPLGYRWWSPDDPYNSAGAMWLLGVYPSPYETVSGKLDGGRCVSGFRLDIAAITRAFAEIEELIWEAPVVIHGNMDSPAVVVQGYFAGKHVRLQIHHMPPYDEPPACRVDTRTGQIVPEGPAE